MRTTGWIAPAALAAGLTAAGWMSAMAQSGPTGDRAPPPQERLAPIEDPALVEERLVDQGYSRVVVVDQEPPYERALGCYDDGDYRLKLDDDGVVVDRERVGRCGGKKSVEVRAPFTDVDVSDSDVRVRAPFAAVDVDKTNGGVRVRAPFVDLHIGR